MQITNLCKFDFVFASRHFIVSFGIIVSMLFGCSDNSNPEIKEPKVVGEGPLQLADSFFGAGEVVGALEPMSAGTTSNCGFCYRDPRLEPPLVQWLTGTPADNHVPAGWVLFDILVRRDCREFCIEKSIFGVGGNAYQRRWDAGSRALSQETVLTGVSFRECDNACYVVGGTSVVWANRFDRTVKAVRMNGVARESMCKLPAQVKLNVVLYGDGLGSVSLPSPATFDRTEVPATSTCSKIQAGAATCVATVSTPQIDSQHGRFLMTALPNRRKFTAVANRGSYLKGWQFENSIGHSVTALGDKCRGAVKTCDLGDTAIPIGTTMKVEFAAPVYLSLDLEKGGTVDNEGSFAGAGRMNTPAIFLPSKGSICRTSQCTILVSDATGIKNRRFNASTTGASGGRFLGWSVVDVSGAEVPGISQLQRNGRRLCSNEGDTTCDLSNVNIRPGWRLRAAWRNTPGGTIELRISGNNEDKRAYLYLPPIFNDGKTWLAEDSNLEFNDPILDGRTNYSRSTTRTLVIPANTDFTQSLNSISAAPDGRVCGKPVFSSWRIERNLDSAGNAIGPDISGCMLSATCWLNELSQVTRVQEFPRSITAIFVRGPSCGAGQTSVTPAPNCTISASYDSNTNALQIRSNESGAYTTASTSSEGSRVAIRAGIALNHRAEHQGNPYSLQIKFYRNATDSSPACSTSVTVPGLPVVVPPVAVPGPGVSPPGTGNEGNCSPRDSSASCPSGTSPVGQLCCVNGTAPSPLGN